MSVEAQEIQTIGTFFKAGSHWFDARAVVQVQQYEGGRCMVCTMGNAAGSVVNLEAAVVVQLVDKLRRSA